MSRIRRSHLALLGACFAFSTGALAQYLVTPGGAAVTNPPPVGDDRKASCGSNCALEVRLKPFCFGTNLRSYSASRQLNPHEALRAQITLINPDASSKRDKISVSFPAQVTYPSVGSRSDCAVTNPGAGGSIRFIQCTDPENARTVSYTIPNWEVEKNTNRTACTTSGDYCTYYTAQLNATTADSNATEKKISCVYKFSGSGRSPGAKREDIVSCHFASRTPNYAARTAAQLNDAAAPLLEMIAHTNDIRLPITGSLQAMPQAQVVRHGKVINQKSPDYQLEFFQGGRQLAAIVESATFDEANAGKTLTVKVKFPGQDGFCGGYYSPLMFFFDGELPEFSGISDFPLYGNKEGARVYWPERGAPGHFLVMSETGAKGITSYKQLFGQTDEFENGFEALKAHDKNKDGKIDSSDAIFSKLALWRDENGDGVAQPEELTSLKQKKIKSIDLRYTKRDQLRFAERAIAKEKSVFEFEGGDGPQTGQVIDVWLAPIDT